MYIDVIVPHPDAKVASILCGPRGPCKYAMREGVELTDDFFCSIAPRCVEVFGRDVLKYLGERWESCWPGRFFGLCTKLKFV